MAICSACGENTTRLRVKYSGGGETHECDKCAPGSFDPQWMRERGVMSWEAYPEKYRKFTLPDGRAGYKATDEMIADTEAKLKNPTAARAEEAQALARRRAHTSGKRKAMTPKEIAAALNKVRPAMEAKAAEEIRQKELARYAWLMP